MNQWPGGRLGAAWDGHLDYGGARPSERIRQGDPQLFRIARADAVQAEAMCQRDEIRILEIRPEEAVAIGLRLILADVAVGRVVEHDRHYADP